MSIASTEIALRAVGKRYGTSWAVRGVTLTVAPGEFFTLLGPSGCGKTTVLRMIAGFLDPDEGEIRLDDRPVAGVPPWRRDLGLVFQSYALWPHLDVFEHVAFGLRERRLAREAIRARVAEALRMVGLDGLEARRPSQLSGGQQQRVALARTLVLRPRALLLDEPLSNLDATLRAQMRVELRRLHRELGITTVYVTHDQEEAMALSTRMAIFDRGAMIQIGTPAEVYRRPRTRFVADFLGGSNVLPGRVERGSRGRSVRLAAGFTLSVLAGADVPDDASVFCIIRPESVRVATEVDDANRFTGRVTGAVYLGGRYDCELALAGGLTLRAEIAASGGGAGPQVGDSAVIVIPPEDVIVLRE
jgi:ABC-type Fe3+/spermidine/putrescine transport system ATPase subunit